MESFVAHLELHRDRTLTEWLEPVWD